jgi:hypothetical protein
MRLLQRREILSIVNPQYGFLKADYLNPNLRQRNKTVDAASSKTQIKDESVLTTDINAKLIFIYNWLMIISADLYCAIIFVLANFF